MSNWYKWSYCDWSMYFFNMHWAIVHTWHASIRLQETVLMMDGSVKWYDPFNNPWLVNTLLDVQYFSEGHGVHPHPLSLSTGSFVSVTASRPFTPPSPLFPRSLKVSARSVQQHWESDISCGKYVEGLLQGKAYWWAESFVPFSTQTLSCGRIIMGGFFFYLIGREMIDSCWVRNMLRRSEGLK